MEIKKSNKADIEKYRPIAFLLGLMVALSLVLACLEYSTPADDSGDMQEAMDDMAQDMELAPAMDRSEMMSATSAVSKSITEKVKTVDNADDNTEKISAQTSELLVGNGEGQAEDAHVTEALPQTPASLGDSLVLTTVEKIPEFPGGMVEFMKWLTANLKYPEAARRGRIEGKVVVSFIINKDGSIASPKIQRSVNPILDNEALRVVKMMPHWKPGISNAKPCRTMFAIPIVFKI